MISRTRKFFTRIFQWGITPGVCFVGDDGGSDGGNDSGDGGNDGGSDGGDGDGSGGGGDNGDSWDALNYHGSVEINPEQRPLKLDSAQRAELESKDEFDDFLRTLSDEMLHEMFMTDEEISALKGGEGDKGAGEGEPDDSGGEPKGGDDDGGDSKSGGDDNPPNVDGFLEAIGLDRKAFQALPKTTQDALVESQSSSASDAGGDELQSAQAEIQRMKTVFDNMRNDPLIAARTKEYEEGKTYIPRVNEVDVSISTTDEQFQELDSLFESGDRGKVDQKLTEIAMGALEEKMSPLLDRFVSAREQNIHQEELRKSFRSWVVGLNDVSGGRLKFSDESFKGDGPPPDSNEGRLFAYLKDHGYSLESATKTAPNEFLAAFATHMGWDREQRQAIANDTKKKLLNALRNPESASKMPAGRSSAASMSTHEPSMEVSEEDLVAEIANGNLDRWGKLVQANEFNLDRLEELEVIREKGEQRRHKGGSRDAA